MLKQDKKDKDIGGKLPLLTEFATLCRKGDVLANLCFDLIKTLAARKQATLIEATIVCGYIESKLLSNNDSSRRLDR